MKYKVGDRVRVRKDLEVGNYYGSQAFAYQMKEYLGKEATITNDAGRWFSIDVDTKGWLWTPEMLEPAPLYKVGDKVLIKNLTEACEDDYSFGIVDEMKDLSNKICTIKSVNLDPDVKDDEEISYDGYEYMLEEDYGEYTWSSDMFVGSVIKTSSNSIAAIPFPFKVGDTVVIRNDLYVDRTYDNGCRFDSDMQEYRDKITTITDISSYKGNPRYVLKIDQGNFRWSPSMLLPYTPGSDYDLDKQIINQQTKQNYENRLQESNSNLVRGSECKGRAVCYQKDQIAAAIGHSCYTGKAIRR